MVVSSLRIVASKRSHTHVFPCDGGCMGPPQRDPSESLHHRRKAVGEQSGGAREGLVRVAHMGSS